MKFYTVKEIANILGVSKTTVQNAIKSAAIDFDKIEKNRQYFSIEKTKKIIEKIDNHFDFCGLQVDLEVKNSPTETEKSPSETDNSPSKTEKSPSETDNSSSKTEKSPSETDNSPTIEKALKILEKQLDEKDSIIKDLQEKLADAYSQISEHSKTIADLATKAQYITAADKTAQIMDKQQQQNEMKVNVSPIDIVSTDLEKDTSTLHKKKKWFEIWK